MRATDIIRNILDLVDKIDYSEPEEQSIHTGVDSNRFKQIFDLLNQDHQQMYNNSPAEQIAGIESVTVNAGGGWNGPKNPADMKSNSISMYPNHQHKPE